MTKLFVYGTLLDPHIQKKVFSRQIEGSYDNLIGYRKIHRQFSDGIYPDLIEDCNSVVKGMVFQITDEDLKKCDLYEGEEYEKLTIKLESGESAEIYIGKKKH